MEGASAATGVSMPRFPPPFAAWSGEHLGLARLHHEEDDGDALADLEPGDLHQVMLVQSDEGSPP